ncbi:MAG: type IX secretion system sortase PorU [Cyclobacteriaceae bacterium]
MNRGTLIALTIMLLSLATQGQSIFSGGSWYKLGVTQAGIYKIDRDYITNTLGINLTNLDANTIKLYGFNGGMLAQENSAPWYNDPPEIAVHRSGVEDGSFDAGDYLLFFAESPDKAKLGVDGSLDYKKNIYSDTAYYFLTIGEETARPIATDENRSAASKTVNTFNDYLTHEIDETNILDSGRDWYSRSFGSSNGESTKDFNYQVQGVGDSIGVYTRLIGQTSSPASFDVLLNQRHLGEVLIDSIPSVESYSELSRVRYTFRGTESFGEFSTSGISSDDMKLTFRFNKGSTFPSLGFIDYFIIGFDRQLKLYGNQTRFRNIVSANESVNYEIRVPEENQRVIVWDITDPKNARNQLYQRTGEIIRFTGREDEKLNEYIIFSGIDFISPKYFGEVENQNIKGQTNVDGVIITTAPFLAASDRLASFHTTHDGLVVAVVTTGQIYNEFSSGRQDITAIRNYLRYLWENGEQIRYALLMGDASYDYKNRVTNNTNFVPVYESRQSLHRLYSHSSDDFIGFFDQDEGAWGEGRLELYEGLRFPVGYTDHTLEIGIGRIPVKTETEANNVVDKIIRYKTSTNALGKWRSEVVYMADDGDASVHMRQAEAINLIVREDYPEFKVSRLFLDNFEKVEQMQDAFQEKLAEGTLILDFLGHGSPSALMQRNEESKLKTVITIPLLGKLKNRHKLPLFVTATCDFGKYDNPFIFSGAEYMILNPNGGAIALLTTTRAVFSSTNLIVNEAFQQSVFKRENGRYPRLGDIMRETKNNSLAGPINRNFSLIGDPMLTLNYPEYEVVFSEIETNGDTLRALEKVTLSGKVVANTGVDVNFNGTGIVTVLDISRKKRTRGIKNSPFVYDEQSNALFRGEVSVINGTFETTFIVPKNSSYSYKKGKIVVYAYNATVGMDAAGASRNFVLGGTSPEATMESSSPAAQLYLNERTFKNGDIVGPSSLFIAQLFDESGINISSSGFNQNPSLSLNDEEPILLNDFYIANKDDFTRGTIVYPLQNLEPGSYQGELKVWDALNNSSSWKIAFNVSQTPIVKLYDVINYPNPLYVPGSTTFSIEHDRVGEQLLIDIEVYDSRGNRVISWDYTIDDSPSKIDFDWNVSEPLSKGVYFYRIEVMSTLDGGRSSVVKRLLIK